MIEIIRACAPDDADALAAIYDPIVATTTISFEEDPPGPAEMRARIVAAHDRFPWLACQLDGTIAGYAYAAQHRTRAAYRWAVDVSVYVAPAVRRTGIAQRLYGALFELLSAQGYCRAFAGVALPNDPSRALHERAGFTAVGVYHAAGFKLGGWCDVLWFERPLRAPDAAPPPEIIPLSALDAAVFPAPRARR